MSNRKNRENQKPKAGSRQRQTTTNPRQTKTINGQDCEVLASVTAAELLLAEGERVTLDMTYADNPDGTVTAWFDTLEGLFIFAPTVDAAAAFLGQFVQVLEAVEKARREKQCAVNATIPGILSLHDLAEVGFVTREIAGVYGIVCRTNPALATTVLQADSLDTLTRFFFLAMQLAITGVNSAQGLPNMPVVD